MSNSDRDRIQIGRKLRITLKFIRSRGPASMTPPITWSEANHARRNWKIYRHPKAWSR